MSSIRVTFYYEKELQKDLFVESQIPLLEKEINSLSSSEKNFDLIERMENVVHKQFSCEPLYINLTKWVRNSLEVKEPEVNHARPYTPPILSTLTQKTGDLFLKVLKHHHLEYYDHNRFTWLDVACRCGFINDLEYFFSRIHPSQDTIDEAVIIAATHFQLESLRIILSDGRSFNDGVFFPILEHAIKEGNTRCLPFLFSKKKCPLWVLRSLTSKEFEESSLELSRILVDQIESLQQQVESLEIEIQELKKLTDEETLV